MHGLLKCRKALEAFEPVEPAASAQMKSAISMCRPECIIWGCERKHVIALFKAHFLMSEFRTLFERLIVASECAQFTVIHV